MKLEDLKVGQFVRTKDGYISQYKYYDTTNAYMEKLLCIPLSNGTFANIEDIVKTSYNIIDILEVGDYVNGMEVTRISGTRYDKNDLHCYCEHNGNENWQQVMIPVKNIKSIVTKEQFEEMSYKIKE